MSKTQLNRLLATFKVNLRQNRTTLQKFSILGSGVCLLILIAFYFTNISPGNALVSLVLILRDVPQVNITHGPIIGDVQPDHARIWIRTNSTAIVTISYGPIGGSLLQSAPTQTSSTSDFTSTVLLTGLLPNTAYTCAVAINGTSMAPCDFTTAPPHGDAADVTVAFVSDVFTNVASTVFRSMGELNPAGFFIIGDYDHSNPGTNVTNSSTYLTKARAMHKRLRDSTTVIGQDFLTHVIGGRLPLLARIMDDHDSGKDNISNNFQFWPQSLQAFQEYHSLPDDNGFASGYMWQSTQRGRALFILMDLRSHRETDSGAKHTTLGDTQKTWLVSKLNQCVTDTTITWCVLVSTVPFNPNQKKLDSWSGYQSDRQWLLDQITAQGVRNVVVVSGDCHWGSIVLPPLSPLAEINIPQANGGFSNTCNNTSAQWTLNSVHAGQGFGLLTFKTTEAVLSIYNADGTLRLNTTIPASQ